MKRIAFAFMILSIFSCKKDDTVTVASTNSASIEGYWDMTSNIFNIYENGTWVTGDTTLYGPGESSLHFRADYWFFEIDSGIVTDSSRYSCHGDTVTFTNSSDTIDFKMTLTNDSLILLNKSIDYSNPPDTTLYETKLTYKKI